MKEDNFEIDGKEKSKSLKVHVTLLFKEFRDEKEKISIGNIFVVWRLKNYKCNQEYFFAEYYKRKLN